MDMVETIGKGKSAFNSHTEMSPSFVFLSIVSSLLLQSTYKLTLLFMKKTQMEKLIMSPLIAKIVKKNFL